MTSLPEDPSPLLSEDDRDTAVQRVQEAYAEGHISHEEMDERLHQVLTAKTHSELVPVLVSLPEEHAGTTSTIAAAGGRIKRRGAWRAPRWKDTLYKPRRLSRPGGPRIRISGTMGFGRLKIRHARR